MGKLKYIYILLIMVSLCGAGIYPKETERSMDELSEKLINTIFGSWVKRESCDNSHYMYALHFSSENKVTFSCYTRENSSSLNMKMAVMRFGTFETRGDTLIVNFSEAKGERYGRSGYSDEPLPENLSATFQTEIVESTITVKETRGKAFWIANPDYIPKDVEITEYKLIVKQISGENLFGNPDKEERIELIAERPIID